MSIISTFLNVVSSVGKFVIERPIEGIAIAFSVFMFAKGIAGLVQYLINKQENNKTK